MRTGLVVMPVALLLAAACGGRTGEAPPRSPTLDYPPPDAQTSDGEVVGADRQAPRDKLASGAHLGSDGPQSGRPATKEPASTVPPPKPCAEVGLEDAAGRPRCTPATGR